jgi:hypothetical protein
MVKYYTGLPSYEILKCVFDFITIDIPASYLNGGACNAFQQVLIVLMKMRLNLGDNDLAYKFNISQFTVSRYFRNRLDVMYAKLSSLILWPERMELMHTMPSEFL